MLLLTGHELRCCRPSKPISIQAVALQL